MSKHVPIQAPPFQDAKIVSDPDIMGGEPVVCGTRVPAATIVAYIEAGWSDHDIFEDYPSLPVDGIEAVRRWQAEKASV